MQKLEEEYSSKHKHPLNRACHWIGIPMIIVSLPILFLHWQWGLSLFVVGWIFQFIGHAIEGTMPAFFSDPRQLVIGPLFFVKKLLKSFRKPKEGDSE